MYRIRSSTGALGIGALVLTLTGLMSSCPASEGYFAHGWGTRAKGLAGASLAYAQDSLSGAANPASIVFMSRRVDFGAALFMPYRHFEAATATGGMFPLAPGREDSEKNLFVCPSLGLNWDLKDGQSSAAFLVYGNGGMNTSYPDSVFGAGRAGVDLQQIFFSPTFARKVSPATDVGVSLIYCLQNFRAEGLDNFASFSSDPTNLTNRGVDTSTGWGMKLGATHQVDKKLAVAAAWQPKIGMSRFERYTGLFAEQGKFDIPENFSVGLAYKSKEDNIWTLDVRTIKYSGVPAIANPFGSPGALGQENGPGFGWRDMTVVKVGHEWKSSPDLTWRLGASYGRQPIPDSEVLFNILAPGVQEWQFTAGMTKELPKGASLNMALLYSPEKKVSGYNPLAPSQKITLAMHQFEFEIGYSKKF